MNLIIFTIFILLIIIYLLRKYYQMINQLEKMPPLVPGKLILGNYFDIDPKSIHLNLCEMGKNYKDLFTIRVLGQNFVVLNSTRAINELLCSRTLECAGRPQPFMLMFATNNFQDLVFSNPNELWHQGRIIFHKFFSEMKRLHERTYFSEIVFFQQWNEFYDDLLTQSGTKSVNLKQILYNTQIKLITTILFGEDVANNKYMLNRIKNLDQYAKLVITHVYEAMLNMQPLSIFFGDKAIANLLKALLIQKDLMKILFDDSNHIPTSDASSNRLIATTTTTSLTSKIEKVFDKFGLEIDTQSKMSLAASTHYEVKKCESENDENICVKSLLDVMKNLLKTNGNQVCNNSSAQLSEQQLMNIMTELIFAGVDTIVNTVNAFFLYLTKHPKIQEKVYNELKATKLSVFYLRHKTQLPYTNACILETLRIISHIPLGIFRRTLVEIECFGYVLPEDTILIPNLWKMHHDEELYPQPYEFKPERFLDSKGQLLDSTHERMKNLMPFGCGKRVCPGKNIASNIIFLSITNMLVNFKFSLAGTVDDDPRSFKLGSNLEANPYEVFIEKRSDVSQTSSQVTMCDKSSQTDELVVKSTKSNTTENKSQNVPLLKKTQSSLSFNQANLIEYIDFINHTDLNSTKIALIKTKKFKRQLSEIKALCTDRSTLVEKIMVCKPNNSEHIYLAE